jgi:hypothetical protein
MVSNLNALFAALARDMGAETGPAPPSCSIPLTGMDVLNLRTGHGISRERAQALAERTVLAGSNLTSDVPQVLQTFDALGHPAEVVFRWDADTEDGLAFCIELIENVAEFVERDSEQADVKKGKKGR